MTIQPVYDVKEKKYLSAEIKMDELIKQNKVSDNDIELFKDLINKYHFDSLIFDMSSIEITKKMIKYISKLADENNFKYKNILIKDNSNRIISLEKIILNQSHKYVILDNEIVKNLVYDDEVQEFTKRTIEILHKTGVKVIADNVENINQSNILIQMGIDKIKGYYYTKPLTTYELKTWALFNK